MQASGLLADAPTFDLHRDIPKLRVPRFTGKAIGDDEVDHVVPFPPIRAALGSAA